MKKLLPSGIIMICLLSVFQFTSCKKNSATNNANTMCTRLSATKIKAEKTIVYVGDNINLTVTDTVDGYYTWTHSVVPNDIGLEVGLSIPATKDYQGTFYLSIYNPDCNSTRHDSINIAVVNKPMTPPCSPVNNTVNFTLIPSISFASATLSIDPSYNCKLLRGYQSYGYPDMNIYFHPYWNSREPEDGAYTISSDISFIDGGIYQVFATTLYSSILFQSDPGTVYVTHTSGGKLQVTLCGLSLTGTLGGPPYTAIATGLLTAP